MDELDLFKNYLDAHKCVIKSSQELQDSGFKLYSESGEYINEGRNMNIPFEMYEDLVQEGVLKASNVIDRDSSDGAFKYRLSSGKDWWICPEMLKNILCKEPPVDNSAKNLEEGFILC